MANKKNESLKPMVITDPENSKEYALEFNPNPTMAINTPLVSLEVNTQKNNIIS